MAAPLRTRRKPFPFAAAARRDSAVHVSLSSDSLVKQHGALAGSQIPPHPTRRHPTMARAQGHVLAGRLFTERSVRGFTDAPSRRAAARREGVYRLREPPMSTPPPAKSRVRSRPAGAPAKLEFSVNSRPGRAVRNCRRCENRAAARVNGGRRTAATFLGRSLQIRVGDVAWGRDGIVSHFGLDNWAALTGQAGTGHPALPSFEAAIKR